MEHFIVRGCTIADPESPWNGQSADLRIRAGVIAEISKEISGDGLSAIDLEGVLVMPGWVDCGAFLQAPGHEERESVSAFMDGAADAGFTDVITHLQTRPSPDTPELLSSLTQQSAGGPVNLHLLANITLGKEGKALSYLHELAQAGAFGFSDGNTDIEDGSLLLRALQYNSSFNTRIFLCPVDQTLSAGMYVYEGELSAKMGLKGIPTFSEALRVQRDKQLAEYAGGMLAFTGISTFDGLLTAGTSQTCVLWLPHLAISQDAWLSFPSNQKVFPPIPPQDDAIQLRNAILSNQHVLLATAHCALSREDIDHDFLDAGTGVAAYPEGGVMLANLLFAQGATIYQVAEVLAIRPRKQFGLPGIKINAGESATLTFFNPNGQAITPGRYPNSSYHKAMKGKVLATLKSGKFRYTAV